MFTWKVGGNTWDKIAEQMEATAYQNEIVSPASSSTYNAKIGLMYVSNYAALTSVNWMYMGLWEWTLTPDTRYSDYSFNVNYSGNIDAGKVSSSYAIRPVFYLNPNVTYVSGEGTRTNPMIIN